MWWEGRQTRSHALISLMEEEHTDKFILLKYTIFRVDSGFSCKTLQKKRCIVDILFWKTVYIFIMSHELLKQKSCILDCDLLLRKSFPHYSSRGIHKKHRKLWNTCGFGLFPVILKSQLGLDQLFSPSIYRSSSKRAALACWNFTLTLSEVSCMQAEHCLRKCEACEVQ